MIEEVPIECREADEGLLWEIVDEITHRLSGAKVFSKLDAKDSFGASTLTQCLPT